MDFEDLDAPQFVDFDLIRQGQDSEEGDEWFDKKAEQTETPPISNQATPVERNNDTANKTDVSGSPSVPDAVQGSFGAAMATEGGSDSEAMPTNEEYDAEKTKDFIRRKLEEKKQLSQNKSTGRTAALKATQSIHNMFKPQSTTASNKSFSFKAGSNSKKPLHNVKCKSTEEMELEKIEELKKRAAKNKALSRRSFKALMAKSKKSKSKQLLNTKPPTEPVEFKFQTEQRFNKSKDTLSSSSGSSGTCFPMNLRSFNTPEYIPNDPSERKSCTPKEPTKVQPFKFHTEERLRSKIDRSSQEKYVSSAEFTEMYEKKTPPRFRTKTQKPDSSERDCNYETRVTIARSPNLQSRYRTRSTSNKILSLAEREEIELEEIKKYKFKAQPFNPEIFRSHGELGLRQPSSLNSKPTTVPVSPLLSTKERVGLKRPRADNEEKELEKEKKKFKAHPMPKDLFTKIRGVPNKRPNEITVPHSPSITKKHIVEENDEKNDQQQKPEAIKPLPLPDFTNVFQPTLTKKHTTVEPFSFDNKYLSKDELVEHLVKQSDEELAKKREFKAKPMPDLVPPLPPVKSTVSTAVVKPFHLETDVRGEQHMEKFNEKVNEMELLRQKATEFKARHCSKYLYSEPALPPRVKLPLTEINSFVLSSETRAEQRAKFEEEKKLRENEKLAVEAERQALKDAEEAKEIEELRRSLVYKAQPIHHYNPIHIQPSTKPVTYPVSPVFMSAGRIRGDDGNHGND